MSIKMWEGKNRKKMENPLKKIRPIIFWSGFPVCGLLLKKIADTFGENVVICGTKGIVPYDGLEETLGHTIVWFDNPNDIWKRKDEFADRNLIFHSGWNNKWWLKYDSHMKRHVGARVVVMADNRFRNSMRQHVGTIWFRLFLKRYFNAALVPGKEGSNLMKFLGMDASKVFTGLYGAYEGVYNETTPIEKRQKEFLFVGQLIERKSVDIIVSAFREYRKAGGTWDLRIIGNGPLKKICIGDGIQQEDFLQPGRIAEKMNSARVFILPSRDDNWGTVVCEAAACGMHLITSKSVGATADLVQNGKNGIVLETISAHDLQKAFFACENRTEKELGEGSRISKTIARQYDSRAFFDVFMKIADRLLEPQKLNRNVP